MIQLSGNCAQMEKKVMWRLIVVLCLVLATGCFEDDAETFCKTGDIQACTGIDGCTGTQVCNLKGSAYQSCICKDQTTDMSDTSDMSSDMQDMTPTEDMSTDMPQSDMSSSVELTLTAMPQQVDSGSFTRLRWSVYNATSCEASDGWMGTQAHRDGVSFAVVNNLLVDTTFTLTCSNATGNISRSVTVTIN